jgi:hypothetical protein
MTIHLGIVHQGGKFGKYSQTIAKTSQPHNQTTPSYQQIKTLEI